MSHTHLKPQCQRPSYLGASRDADTAWLVARIHDLEREVQEMNKTQRLLMVKLLEHL